MGVGIKIVVVVEDAPKDGTLVPEDVLWAATPAEAAGTVTAGCTEASGAVPCAAAVAPEFAVLELTACGVGWPAGTSVALLSGRAMDMRDSRRRSFSVSKELRRITG